MSTHRVARVAREFFDRALRVTMSAALIAAYVNIQVLPPTPAVAAPATLSVSASISAKPLLGGKATIHVTVKNTDTTDKAYNISIKDVLSSSRPDPQGVVTFVSASDISGALAPTSNSTNAATGDTTLSFINIRDLAPQETYSADIVVDISGDATWAVGDLIQNAITVYGNTIPNQTNPDISASTSVSAKVVPITIKNKTVHQSTGVEQATGTTARQFYYTIDVQNNYTGPTQSVVVTDTIPDGIQYLGAHGASPAPTSISHDASTGVTTLVWNLGTMPASGFQQLAYDAGIRYDYYGTDNGGKNRADASALTSSSAGQPIITTASAKKTFTNDVALQGSWLSNPATDTASANVTGAALTVAKSSDKSSGGLGTVINYTLTYATSQYYSAIATTNSVLVHDHLPDGQILTTGSPNPAATSVQHNPDGSTDVTWTVGAVGPSNGGSITFAAVVGTNWQEPSYAGDPIVSGDSMTNRVDIQGECVDQISGGLTHVVTSSSSSVGFSTSLPQIFKSMKDPVDGQWKKGFSMTVGDTSTVRVQFNTVDGVNPLKSDINMGNIFLTDWLPAGMSIIPGTFHITDSSPNDFTTPTAGTPPPINLSTPTTGTVSGLDYASWYVGNVGPSGWLEATFDVVVNDVPAAADGVITANMWKLTGTNTFGTPYSQRDQVMINYAQPHLTLSKTVAPPVPLTGGSQVPYTLTIKNTGSGSADQVSVVDTLPVGQRATAPSVDSVKLDGTTLTPGSDYVTSYNGATGALSITLQQGAVRTDVPAGSLLEVAYTATVDAGVAANSSLTNTATVGYSTRPTPDGHVTPGTSNPADDNTDVSTIKIDGLKIAKTGSTPSTFTVGDVFGYDLDVTVPAHTIAYWPTVADLLSHEGVVATGAPTITTLSGSPVVPASFSATASAPVRTTPVSGQTLLTFALNDPIDNTSSNSAYTFRIHFNVQYTGLKAGNVWEFQPPAVNDSFADTGTVAWNSVPSAIRQTNSSGNSGSVTTNLVQPLLKTVKTVTSAGPYYGGSTIDYQLVITNVGTSRAYNVSLDDTLPAAAVDATLTSMTLTGPGALGASDVSSFVATPTMKVVFNPATVSVSTTQTLTIKYRVTLSPSLGAGVALTNTADVDWTSLPGAPGSSRIYNDSGQENWTQDTSTQTKNAAAATITKRGPAGPVQIGDELTYSIDATVPANTVAWYPVFADTLNMRGVSYVSNSATITTRANAPSVPATLGGSSTPTTSTSAPSNTIMTWSLPGAIDNSGNPQPYAFTLTFHVQVTGLNAGAWEYWPATNAQTISDSATMKWRDVANGGPATNQTASSGAVVTSVKQPLITSTKTILTPGPLAGGSVVDYQVVLANSGYNTAYDVSTTDTFPVEVASATLATATETGVGNVLGSATTDFSHLPTSSVSFASGVSLGTTQTITLVYHCSLDSTVGAGATLTNNFDANWSTQPGAVPGERVYNDSPSEASWTNDTTSVTTQTPLVTFGKRIPSGLTTATIGTVVPYTIEATVPANTTAYGLTITDTVPASLQVLAALPSALLPAPVVSVPTSSGTLVTEGPVDWPVAPASSPTTLAITLMCQVRDISYSGAAVANGVVANSAAISWKTRALGGSTLNASAGPVNFTVVQPILTITKTALPTSAGPGDVVTFTSVLTNTGNSPACATTWSDVLPATMNNPTLLSVKQSALPTLTAGTDFSTSAAGNTLAVALDQPSSPFLAPGQSLTVRFTGAANAGVHNGTSMVDTATIGSYSSLITTGPPARTYGPTSATASVTALSPALIITKSVTSDPYPLQGDTVHYQVLIKNVGTSPALTVTATDTLPADLTYVAGTTSAKWPSAGASSTVDPAGGTGPTLAWNFGGAATLGAGETLTLVFAAKIAATAPIGSRINTVTTGATDALGSPVPANASGWIPADTNPTDSSTALIRITKPGVAVAKVLATGGDQFVQVGDKTGFKLTVTNTGDTTLTAVPLTDTYDPVVLSYFSANQAPSSSGGGTVKWNAFGTIAPGASRSVNVTFTVLAQPASHIATNYVGVANVVDEFSHTLASTQDTATVTVTHPAVSIAKVLHASQDTTIQAGQNAVYDITVTNTGDTTLTTVPLSDAFVAADLSFVSATTTPTTQGSGSLTWANVGPLAPGAATTVVATFTALAAPVGNTSVDTARCNGSVDEHGDSPSNVNATSSIAITRPQVSVVKTLLSDPVIQAGQTATFKLTVTNTGDTVLSTIPLADSWDGSALGSPSAVPAGLFGAGTGTWTLVGPLAPGASTVVTLTLTALSVPSGQVTSDTATVGTATDTWGDSAPGNSSSASVRVTHPAIALAKTLHAGQDPQVQVGQSVAYDLTLTNTGDTTLTTVPLTDTYDPAALTYVSASQAANSVAGGVASWTNTGALAPGASRTIVATFTAAAVPSGQVTTDTVLTHLATDQYADAAPDASAAASVRITAPGVTVVKTRALGQDPQIQVGQNAAFDLAITNTGNTTLATETLTDTWDPTVFAFSGATAVPSASASGSATWTLGSLAPGATTTVTVTLLALSSPVGLTTTDSATVSGTDVYGDAAGPSNSSADVMVTQPAVAVLKTLAAGQDPQIQVGQTVRFDLRVTNSGNTPLATIPLSDAFDGAALSFTTATVAPTSTGSGALSWSDIGPLGVGATRVITVTFTALAVPSGQVTVDSLASTGTVDIYSDPAPDASATGSIRITHPAVAVTKALNSGQDPAVQAGQNVAFDIVITNIGDTTLTTVPMTDTYDSARLVYAGGSPVADATGLGTAHWNNLGVLAPGASTTVTANFTALSNPPGQVTTDTVTVPTATDQYGDHPADPNAAASVKVTHPAYTLTKTRVTDGAIQSSQTVTFDLTVHNTGDTTLTAVPLSDTWDASYLAFFASNLPGVIGTGSGAWDVAPIAPGGSASVQVTLVALQAVPGLTTVDHAAVTGAKDENGDPATDATSSATVDITSPSVAVTKALEAGQDAHIQPGDPVAYTITVANSGDTTLTDVPLTDTFDATHLSYANASPAADSVAGNIVKWNNLGTLTPGQTTTVTARFIAETTGTAILDVASASGTDVNGDPAAPKSATDSVLRITAPSIAIAKTPHAGQDLQIQAGEKATFDLTVTNTGDTILTTPAVVDTWDGSVFAYDSSSISADTTTASSCSMTAPTLAPGASAVIQVTLLALASPADLLGADHASVSATDEFGDAVAPASADSSVLVTRPGVTVAKTRHAGQDTVIQSGQSVTYDLTVTNSGNTTLTAVPLADTFDATALGFASSTTAPDATTPAGSLAWTNVGPLAPGAHKTISVTFTAIAVPTDQVTTDTAKVALARDLYGDTAPDSSSTADVRITHPAVSIVKVPVPGQDAAIQAGQSATFTITITNTGDTTLTAVPLTDTYDDAVLAFAGATPGVSSSAAGTLTWNNLGALAPGASTTVTVSFSAIKPASGQVTIDTAAVQGATDQYGDHPADVSAAAHVKVTHPSLSLSKTLATDQDLFIQTGQTATFHLAVTNTGDTTLTAVPLSDGWDATYLQFASASVLPATSATGLAMWTLGPIAPGATSAVDLTLVALGPVPAFVTTDTAVVHGAVDENADPANDDASSASISITKPSIAITKQLHAGQDTAIQVGQSVTYDIGVTNVGDITMAAVPLTDAFDSAVFAPVSASPSFDSTDAASATWNNIGPLNPGETKTITVTFTAIGTSNRVASVDTATVAGATDIHGDGTPMQSANAAELVTRPRITLTKSLAPDQPATVRLGSLVIYDLTATNNGDTTLTTIPLTDTYNPSEYQLVAAVMAPTLATTGTISWDNVAPGPIGPGESVTTKVQFRTLVAGNALTNQGAVPGATDDHADVTPPSGASDSSLSVYDPASLAVTKTADPVAGTILLPGQVITYTLSWNNAGGVTMPGVLAADPLPDSVRYLPGTIRSGDTTLTDAVDADAGQFDSATRTVRVNLGDVPAEAHGSITFKVQVLPENLSAKGVLNTATFASQEATVATAGPVYHPVDPITISKVGKDVNGGSLRGGDVIEWTITIHNIGLTQTTHVVITDTVPSTTTYVNGSIRGKGANDSKRPNLRWDIGTMAVGETQVVKFRSTVKKGLPSGTLIKNQAVVSSDQSRPKKSDNPQTATKGDPTILVARTSGSEDWRMPTGAALVALMAGLWLWPRRKKLAVVAVDEEGNEQEVGDRDE